MLFRSLVMIHHALLSSVKRFIAILTKHFAGKWCVAPLPYGPHKRLLISWCVTGPYGSRLARSLSILTRHRTKCTRSRSSRTSGKPASTPTSTSRTARSRRRSARGRPRSSSGETAQYNFIFGPFPGRDPPLSARLTSSANSRRKRGGRHRVRQRPEPRRC